VLVGTSIVQISSAIVPDQGEGKHQVLPPWARVVHELFALGRISPPHLQVYLQTALSLELCYGTNLMAPEEVHVPATPSHLSLDHQGREGSQY
jgi:hypothetical protein